MFKSRIPLQKWFLAIYLLDNNEITATELSKKLGVTKPTAGRLLRLLKSNHEKWHTLIKGIRIWMENREL